MAVIVRPNFRSDVLRLDVSPHHLPFAIPIKRARIGVVLRVGIMAPTIEMNGDMQWLAAVRDEMAPKAEIAKDEHFAAPPVVRKPRLLARRQGRSFGDERDTPIAEIVAQLLPAFD